MPLRDKLGGFVDSDDCCWIGFGVSVVPDEYCTVVAANVFFFPGQQLLSLTSAFGLCENANHKGRDHCATDLIDARTRNTHVNKPIDKRYRCTKPGRNQLHKD